MASSSILWPADSEKVGTSTLWGFAAPKCSDDIRLRPLIAFADWEAMMTTPMSPLLIFQSMSKQAQRKGCFPKRWARAEGGPKPLLTIAAQHCFWQIGDHGINMLIQHEYPALGLDVADSMPHKLHQLILHILKVGSDEALDRLQGRAMLDVVQDEDCQ